MERFLFFIAQCLYLVYLFSGAMSLSELEDDEIKVLSYDPNMFTTPRQPKGTEVDNTDEKEVDSEMVSSLKNTSPDFDCMVHFNGQKGYVESMNYCTCDTDTGLLKLDKKPVEGHFEDQKGYMKTTENCLCNTEGAEPNENQLEDPSEDLKELIKSLSEKCFKKIKIESRWCENVWVWLMLMMPSVIIGFYALAKLIVGGYCWLQRKWTGKRGEQCQNDQDLESNEEKKNGIFAKKRTRMYSM